MSKTKIFEVSEEGTQIVLNLRLLVVLIIFVSGLFGTSFTILTNKISDTRNSVNDVSDENLDLNRKIVLLEIQQNQILKFVDPNAKLEIPPGFTPDDPNR